jgi:hypothetical protein
MANVMPKLLRYAGCYQKRAKHAQDVEHVMENCAILHTSGAQIVQIMQISAAAEYAAVARGLTGA